MVHRRLTKKEIKEDINDLQSAMILFDYLNIDYDQKDANEQLDRLFEKHKSRKRGR